MGQERPDMFDVACGECKLLDFLLTRFNPLDLKTKINLAPSAVVDEQCAPVKPAEDEPETQPPPDPRPSALAFIADVRDRLAPPAAAPPRQDSFQPIGDSLQAPPSLPPEAPPPPPKGPDWLSLIQGFHAAAQRYQAEIEEDPDAPDEGP